MWEKKARTSIGMWITEQVPCLKRLEMQINGNGKLQDEIIARVAAAGKIFSAVNEKCFFTKRETA